MFSLRSYCSVDVPKRKTKLAMKEKKIKNKKKRFLK